MKGDVYTWDTNKLETNLTKTYEVDLKDLCSTQNDQFFMIGPENNYVDAMNYCKNIGAKIGVIKNADEINQIKDIFNFRYYS